MVENLQSNQDPDEFREHDTQVAREMAELTEPYWMLRQYLGDDADPSILEELDEKIRESEEEARLNIGEGSGLGITHVVSRDTLSSLANSYALEQAELETRLKFNPQDEATREKLSLIHAELTRLRNILSSEERPPLSRKRK